MNLSTIFGLKIYKHTLLHSYATAIEKRRRNKKLVIRKVSRCKVEFMLEQHTPIIHFQSEQMGATLRATELKPKFDRFLLQQEKDLPTVKNANGSLSLDYKVKIVALSPQIEEIEKTNPKNGKKISDPLFFGNMGDSKKKKFITSKSIQVEFKSFEGTILKAIQQHFEAFLANSNFGTRQSKGYGSFYLQKSEFNQALIACKVYSFSSKNWKKDVKLLYSFLRTGINSANFGGIYAKAGIFSYAKSQGWTWDKKAIKAKYLRSQLREQQKNYLQNNNCIDYTSKKTYLLRDLFGLSSEQSWNSYRATITKENRDIDRFKSPITFKVVDNRVYFWANSSVEEMVNKTFKIQYNKRGDLRLKTPQRFHFKEFFDYVFALDLSSYIDPQFHNDKNGEYKALVRIFQEIQGD